MRRITRFASRALLWKTVQNIVMVWKSQGMVAGVVGVASTLMAGQRALIPGWKYIGDSAEFGILH